MSITVRPFERRDREQLAGLVNAHIAAVVPGISVSVNTVMSQLERELREPIVGPWVVDRRTLVAVEREAIVAGAHLLRYGTDEQVGDWYRNAGEISWLVCRPRAEAAGHALVIACLAVFEEWQVAAELADGSLPAIATYGVPGCWPHVRDLYLRAGFAHKGQVEIILVAPVDELPRAGEPPHPDLAVRRTLSDWTRFSAILGGEEIGLIEVETDFTEGGSRSRLAGWADIGNLWVREDHRRHGVGTWLLGVAADWLRLGRVDRLLAYAWPEELDDLGFLEHSGFRELTRTERGWRRQAGVATDARAQRASRTQ
jgi:GNAT superfamily N-acetyltransferase